MKTALIILADTHINSKYGLSDLETPQDNGGLYVANKLQRWLYWNFQDFATKVAALKEQGYKIVLVLNGDIVDMNKKSGFELINHNPVHAKRHALSVLKALATLADVRYMTKGTPTHVGEAAHLEEDLAQLLDMIYYEHLNEYTTQKLKLLIDGLRFNIAHHGNTGRKAWTATNPILSWGADLIIEHVRRGETLPNVVVRSDKHIYLDTHETLPVRFIQGPCFQFPNDYVHKLKIERQATFGGLIFEIRGGEYTLREDTFYELDHEQYNPTYTP